MAQVVNMPRLSDTMEEGVVAKWLKKVGDFVDEGDVIAEIETDKATMEFENPFDGGTLLHIGIPEGETAPVDSLLAILGEKGEDISGLFNGTSQEKKEEPEVKKEKKEEGKEASAPAPSASIPEGVEVVRMPRLSDTMEEGTVASWLKKVDDQVEEGDILAEIETDKATMEFESFYSGVLLHIGIAEGETAPVDAVLAVIGPKGTDVQAVLNSIPADGASAEVVEKEAPSPEAATPTTTETSSITSPGHIEESGTRIFVSPLAKKMAKDMGIPLSKLKGSGENGRIIKRDIENYKPEEAPVLAVSAPATSSPVPMPFAPAGEERFEDVRNSQMRKAIARRLADSKFSAPHYYLTIELDMDNAILARKAINELPDTKVSFNDMVVKACAMALKKHPQVNTTWNGDTMRYNHHVHIGVAVAVDEGLMVPVLRFTDQMSLTVIDAQVRDMAKRARDRKLTPQEMEGSTFTVSNLGMFGILEFTSIINQPNSAILSVGAIVQRPVVKDGEIVVGNTMKITLACDHRTVDGATGSLFLQTLRRFIENPMTMLA